MKRTTSPAASPRQLAFGTLTGFVAFGLGAGLVPLAPGTAGSALAIPLAVPLLQLHPGGFWAAWLVSFLAGAWCCDVTSRRLGDSDPGGIVWDEIVALWLVLACVPRGWSWWLAAFVLFRLFDITKPWPIRALERRVGGGLGIMLDDLVAGVFALAILLPLRLALGV